MRQESPPPWRPLPLFLAPAATTRMTMRCQGFEFQASHRQVLKASQFVAVDDRSLFERLSPATAAASTPHGSTPTPAIGAQGSGNFTGPVPESGYVNVDGERVALNDPRLVSSSALAKIMGVEDRSRKHRSIKESMDKRKVFWREGTYRRQRAKLMYLLTQNELAAFEEREARTKASRGIAPAAKTI